MEEELGGGKEGINVTLSGNLFLHIKQNEACPAACGQNLQPANESALPAKWMRNKMDLAEIIFSLYEEQAIEVNGKPATIEFLQNLFERAFGISLGEISIMDNKIRNRKKDTTPYLDKLAGKILARKERLDPRRR